VARVAIALGSNLGDRASHLSCAVERLRQLLGELHVSSYFETEPVGVGPQPTFLNAAVTAETSLAARELLTRLLAIEKEHGRERPQPGAARTLDLDLILYGDEVIDEPELQVPHPRFRERRFVLEPLAAIASDWRDPVTGATVGELLEVLRVVRSDRGPSPHST
jgi:2-amino-4-hydroxy-6-hydroxymethyldihydropteridine diphosphokinase